MARDDHMVAYVAARLKSNSEKSSHNCPEQFNATSQKASMEPTSLLFCAFGALTWGWGTTELVRAHYEVQDHTDLT